MARGTSPESRRDSFLCSRISNKKRQALSHLPFILLPGVDRMVGAAGTERAASTELLRFRDRSRELRLVHWSVRIDLRDHVLFTSADPAEDPFVRHEDAVHRAIVRIVDLRRNAADRRVRGANITRQQAGLLIEIERRQKTRVASLQHGDILAIERGRVAHLPVRESFARPPGNAICASSFAPSSMLACS